MSCFDRRLYHHKDTGQTMLDMASAKVDYCISILGGGDTIDENLDFSFRHTVHQPLFCDFKTSKMAQNKG